MYFASCHMGWWGDLEEPFKLQADRLLAQIPADMPVFLMGDFNNCASVRGEGYDYLRNNGFYDTYSLACNKDDGTTVQGKIAGWGSNVSDLRLDQIWSNRLYPVSHSRVVFNDRNGQVVSDHYGVEVVLNATP